MTSDATFVNHKAFLFLIYTFSYCTHATEHDEIHTEHLSDESLKTFWFFLQSSNWKSRNIIKPSLWEFPLWKLMMAFILTLQHQSLWNRQRATSSTTSICPWSFISILQLEEASHTIQASLWEFSITNIDLCFPHSHLSTNLDEICREYIPQWVLLVPEVSWWSSNWTGHCAPSRHLFFKPMAF